MAKFFYVKSGYGTNTGATPFTTKQSGAFSALNAADCYDSISDITGIFTGDFIFVSHVHNKVYPTVTTLVIANGDEFVSLVSVDDLNCEVYKKGAHEEVTTGHFTVGDQNLKDGYAIYGMSFEAVAGELRFDGYHANVTHKDGFYRASGVLHFGIKNCNSKVYDCDMAASSMSINGRARFFGGVAAMTGYITKPVQYLTFNDVDFSASTAGIYLLSNSGLTVSADINFINCLLPVNYATRQATTYDRLFTLSLIGCDDYYTFSQYTKYSEIT